MPNKLRVQQGKVGEKIKALVATAETLQDKTSTDEGDVYLISQLDGEQLAEWDKLVAEYNRVGDAITIEGIEAGQKRIGEASDDLYGSYRERQVQVNVKAYNDLMAVGRNDYTNPGKVAQRGHPTELTFHPPAVVRTKEGINQVQAFPAVWDAEGNASVEMSYRWAEIIKAAKTGDYDPRSGNRISMATDPVDSTDIPASIPDLVTELYENIFYISPLAQICNLYQTAELNPLPVEKRTGLPTAALVTEAAEFALSQPDYAETPLGAYKYGLIVQYSYEASRQVTPWRFSNKLATDGGYALGRVLDQLLITGTGSNQPHGVLTLIKATSAMQVAGIAVASIFATAWGVDDVLKITEALPLGYDMLPSARVMCRKPTWVRTMEGLLTDNKVINPRNIYGLIDVLLNNNNETFASAGDYPFITLAAETIALRMAGPLRVDFSSEFGFRKDLLSYRIAQHLDCAPLDTSGARGYKLS